MTLRLFVNSVLGTLFVFLVIFAIGKLPIFNTDIFNPIERMLKDFQVTDVVFSKLKERPPVDTNVVLVNIGELPRDGIAAQINAIEAEGPRVIGIDAFFRSPKDPEGDSLLADAIANAENLVLVSKLVEPDTVEDMFLGLETSHPMFNQHAETGFANLITEGNPAFNTARTFEPVDSIKNLRTEMAFAAKLASYYYPEKTKRFLARNNEKEIINFTRPEYLYYTVDAMDVFSPERAVSFKDKIVLMGFMGRYIGEPSMIDRFYTPLNEEYAGKSSPDMYGVAVHANIISMIKEENYIDESPEWVMSLITIFFIWINIYFFIWVDRKYGIYFALITKTVQLVVTGALLYFLVIAFMNYNLKLDLTNTITVEVLSADLLEMYLGLSKTLYYKFGDRVPILRRFALKNT